MEVNPGSMDVEKISELINRRRRQILVHSIIYYKMDKNLIADNAWSEWGAELEALQAQYPEIGAMGGEEGREFDVSARFGKSAGGAAPAWVRICACNQRRHGI